MKDEPKFCRNCGEAFYGRSNKTFCDSRCRSGFHNKKYGEVRKLKDIGHQKGQILKHLNTIMQVVLFDLDEINEKNIHVDGGGTECPKRTMSLLRSHTIRREVNNIKSILRDSP